MQTKSFILLLLLPVIISSCNNTPAEQSTQSTDQRHPEVSGADLARAYCENCHVDVEPQLLDKNTWKYGLLPQMGFRMGIYHDTERQTLIESNAGGRLVEQHNIFPLQPVINEAQWKLIQDYFYQNAPDSLTIPVKNLKTGIPGLTVKIPEFHISPPMVTAIRYHPELKQFFVADTKADYSTINLLNDRLQSVSTLAIPSPASQMEFKSDTIWATLMGSFTPSDNPSGSIIKIFKPPGEREYKGFTTVIKNLQRPVHTTYADINEDSLEDIVVCEYGNHTGSLSLYINLGNGQYQKKILSADPGATSVVIEDLNQDGQSDIVALMGQGNERIDVYFNQGDGNFNAENLLRFPPSYGSVALSMVDWNRDGHQDILYVNGDNADFSMTLKPYHGLRLFLNDGSNNFRQAFFQHQNGAYKAISHDFDLDGDLDIAMISFFPDLINTPEEGFIFMENISTEDSIKFDHYTFKQAALGRWLIMEAADVNGDNLPELMLGSFTGMGVNGDVDGKIANQYVRTSPTLTLLKFK